MKVMVVVVITTMQSLRDSAGLPTYRPEHKDQYYERSHDSITVQI